MEIYLSIFKKVQDAYELKQIIVEPSNIDDFLFQKFGDIINNKNILCTALEL